MRKNISINKIYERIKTLLTDAREHVVHTVNTVMVCTYYEIGRIIIENEQEGKERAEYGAKILEDLSKKLTKEFGKGFTKRNLELMRQLYIVYGKANTLSSQSSAQQEKSLTGLKTFGKSVTIFSKSHKFVLSWSHYVLLMRLEERERNFYEIEAIENNWSLRELKR